MAEHLTKQTFLEKVFKYKPAEEYQKNKIKKIKSILGTIYELHKNTF